MTWTKLGDEFSDEARDLTDAEHRTHVDALGWSNRRGLDLLIPKRDLRKFAESPHAEEAVSGLLAKGWWEERGDCWYAGLRFPEWQLERAVVKQRKEANALRVRRSRMHKAGDHSICMAGNCPAVTGDVMHYDMRDETHYPGRVGSGATHPPDPENQDQPKDQSQGQDPRLRRPSANPQKPRVHRGPGPMAGQAQQFPLPDSERATDGTGARARHPAA